MHPSVDVSVPVERKSTTENVIAPEPVKGKRLTCFICSNSFKTLIDLFEHGQTHKKHGKDGKTYFDCSKCDKKFLDMESLKKHFNFTHKGLYVPCKIVTGKGKMLKCFICSNSFKKMNDLYEHHQTHQKQDENGKTYFECSKCDKKFPELKKLRGHFNFVHKGLRKCVPLKIAVPNPTTELTDVKCDQCDKIFKKNIDLSYHKRIVHEGETPFGCGKCNKSFAKPSDLNEHIQIDHEELIKKIDCDQCDKKFSSKGILNRHVKIVHLGLVGDKIQCEECGKMIPESKIIKHIDYVHKGKFKCVCSICGKTFSDNTVMKRHIASVHEGLRPHQCNECGESFTQITHLKDHYVRCHEKIKKFVCETCGNAYYTKYDLKRHVDVAHLGIKIKKTNKNGNWSSKKITECKYECGYKGFYHAVNTHQKKVHEGVRYECKICNKSYSEISGLRCHIRSIHEQEKNQTCDHCGKTFFKKSALLTHVRCVHEGRKDFECDQCDKAYGTKHELKKHLETVHQGFQNVKRKKSVKVTLGATRKKIKM